MSSGTIKYTNTNRKREKVENINLTISLSIIVAFLSEVSTTQSAYGKIA